jgi:hypothetical protein
MRGPHREAALRSEYLTRGGIPHADRRLFSRPSDPGQGSETARAVTGIA